ncbi:hypothetical protein SAMN05877838_4011, partial [Hoeflea halophila]
YRFPRLRRAFPGALPKPRPQGRGFSRSAGRMSEAVAVAAGVEQMQLGPSGLKAKLFAGSQLLMARHPGSDRFDQDGSWLRPVRACPEQRPNHQAAVEALEQTAGAGSSVPQAEVSCRTREMTRGSPGFISHRQHGRSRSPSLSVTSLREEIFLLAIADVHLRRCVRGVGHGTLFGPGRLGETAESPLVASKFSHGRSGLITCLVSERENAAMQEDGAADFASTAVFFKAREPRKRGIQLLQNTTDCERCITATVDGAQSPHLAATR